MDNLNQGVLAADCHRKKESNHSLGMYAGASLPWQANSIWGNADATMPKLREGMQKLETLIESDRRD